MHANGPPPARPPGPLSPRLPPGTQSRNNTPRSIPCRRHPVAAEHRREQGCRAHRKIGEILVDLGVIKGNDVNRVLDALSRRLDRQKFGQMAQTMGLLREEHILAALAVQMDLFPGIDRMSIHQILSSLQDPKPETPTASA